MLIRVDVVKHAQRQIWNLAPQLQQRVLGRITALGANPYPTGAIELVGPPDLSRIRVGDYRVISTLEVDVLLGLVVTVAHRKEVYRAV